jgi:hypothetical protein
MLTSSAQDLLTWAERFIDGEKVGVSNSPVLAQVNKSCELEVSRHGKR